MIPAGAKGTADLKRGVVVGFWGCWAECIFLIQRRLAAGVCPSQCENVYVPLQSVYFSTCVFHSSKKLRVLKLELVGTGEFDHDSGSSG